jgi:hypothetical protein
MIPEVTGVQAKSVFRNQSAVRGFRYNFRLDRLQLLVLRFVVGYQERNQFATSICS